jgi:hypothetical protein
MAITNYLQENKEEQTNHMSRCGKIKHKWQRAPMSATAFFYTNGPGFIKV